jgi:hypothetical protein
MMNKSAGQAKSVWETIIKENMVTIDGSESIYKLNDKRNSSVEIHYGAAPFKRHFRRNDQPSEMQPAVGQSNATLDVASPDFLVLSQLPAAMKVKHFIPWKKIVEIVFLDD